MSYVVIFHWNRLDETIQQMATTK